MKKGCKEDIKDCGITFLLPLAPVTSGLYAQDFMQGVHEVGASFSTLLIVGALCFKTIAYGRSNVWMDDPASCKVCETNSSGMWGYGMRSLLPVRQAGDALCPPKFSRRESNLQMVDGTKK